MGADMMLSAVPCPAEINELQVQSLRRVLDGLSADELALCLTHYADTTGQDVEEGDYLQEMRDCINYLPALNDRRDTCGFYVQGMRYLVSGGLSWGDQPTEACEEIEKLTTCEPLWFALEKLARYGSTPDQETLRSRFESLVGSADDTGCCDGLTVVDGALLEAVSEAVANVVGPMRPINK